MNHNVKPHTVVCLTCHKDSESSEPNPKCPVCGHPLYTVNYSAIDGRRITPR